jgi:hypothetical protein
VVFDLVVQIAEKGDKVEDPSIAWPDSRKTVKLGTFLLTKITDEPAGRAEGALVPARLAASGRRAGRSHAGAAQHRLSHLFGRTAVETRAILTPRSLRNRSNVPTNAVTLSSVIGVPLGLTGRSPTLLLSGLRYRIFAA